MLLMIKEKRKNKKPCLSARKSRLPVQGYAARNFFFLFFSGNARPFDMKISNYGCKDFQPALAKMFLKDDKRVVFKFKREYQCTCLCFNRYLLY